MDETYHTTAEVAALLGLAEETIRRYCRRGVIRSVHVGRKHHISHAEIERLQESGLHVPKRITDEQHNEVMAMLRRILAHVERSNGK